jgi:hypothetical protein
MTGGSGKVSPLDQVEGRPKDVSNPVSDQVAHDFGAGIGDDRGLDEHPLAPRDRSGTLHGGRDRR